MGWPRIQQGFYPLGIPCDAIPIILHRFYLQVLFYRIYFPPESSGRHIPIVRVGNVAKPTPACFCSPSATHMGKPLNKMGGDFRKFLSMLLPVGLQINECEVKIVKPRRLCRKNDTGFFYFSSLIPPIQVLYACKILFVCSEPSQIS